MTNTRDNEQCWNCSHFQRYITGATPDTTEGECRRQATKAYRFLNIWFDEYEPFIWIGGDFWCSCWKITDEENLPPNPGSAPPHAAWPDVFWTWTPWNKWGTAKSCLNCSHFDLCDPQDPQDLCGECRKNPPEPVIDADVDGTIDTFPGEKMQFWGPTYWCSEWQKLERPDDERTP